MCTYTSWSQDVTAADLHQVLETLCLWELLPFTGSDGPADKLLDLVLSNDIAGVLSFSVDYNLPFTCEYFAALRQVLALFQKRSDLTIIGVDPKQVAKDKFLEAESLCRETNAILKMRREGLIQFESRVERVFRRAQQKIADILGGTIPKLSELRMRFGPGATSTLPKRMASARAKLGDTLTCSLELFPLATSVMREAPGWYAMHTLPGHENPDCVISHGKVQFVPKSVKEHRAIMVEPLLNTFVQSGMGSWLAQRLNRCGVDIRDQSKNQRLARKGSVDSTLATVDLSSASDTIALELVYDLLGVDFAHWLRYARTGTAVLDGQEIKLAKFSSMGNGYTFPLETIIFYALAYASARESGCPTTDVNAYGDDIIVPSGAVDLLYSTLRALGFNVNEKKSYSSGPFRESCGADYFMGVDIRPLYLKGSEGRVLVADLFRIHNHYHRRYSFDVCAYIRQFLHSTIRIYGPDGYGDGHLLGEEWSKRKRSHAARGFAGYVFDTFTWKSRESFWPSRGDHLLPAYTTYLLEEARGMQEGSPAARSWDGDSFSVTVPGRRGFNRISVYTLKPE
jgi:hypothetical protein